MSDYSYGDMLRLQSEAKKRVMEMQKRSKAVAESFNSGHTDKKEYNETEKAEELPRVPRAISYPAELHTAQQKQHTPIRNMRPQGASFDIKKALFSVFGDLSNDDYEKMFILSLCLLLTKENKDDSLVLR